MQDTQNKKFTNKGTLFKGVLILSLLNNPFASRFLINFDFLLPHIAHFDNITVLPLLVAKTFGLMLSVFFFFFFYTLNKITLFLYLKLSVYF